MKKLISTLIAVIVCFAVVIQFTGCSIEKQIKHNVDLVKSITTYEGMEAVSRSVFEYDDNGRIVSVITRELTGENPEATKTEYIYDGQGNVVFEKRDYEENGEWVNYRKYEYVYDDSGNLLDQKVYSWEDDRWTKNYKYERFYTIDGYLAYSVDYYGDESGEVWEGDIRTVNSYDEDGNVFLSEYYSFDDGKWHLYGTNENEYDTNGRLLISVSTDFDDDGEIKEKTKYEYSYDGNLTVSTEFVPNGLGGWKITGKTEERLNGDYFVSYGYTFDESKQDFVLEMVVVDNEVIGNVISSTVEFFDGENFITTLSRKCFMLNNGNISLIEYLVFDMKNTYIFEYEKHTVLDGYEKIDGFTYLMYTL